MLASMELGSGRRFHPSAIYHNDDCDTILETQHFPRLLLYQDREPTPVSDVISRKRRDLHRDAQGTGSRRAGT
jgi:hypothetical protein